MCVCSVDVLSGSALVGVVGVRSRVACSSLVW